MSMKTNGLPTFNEVVEWINTAPRGATLRYHVGHLADDRSAQPRNEAGEIRQRELNLSAAALLRAAGVSSVEVSGHDSRAAIATRPATVALVQRRVAGAFEYLARKL